MYNYNKQQRHYRILENAKDFIIISDTTEEKKRFFIIAYKSYKELKKDNSLLTQKQRDNIDSLIYNMRESIKSSTK